MSSIRHALISFSLLVLFLTGCSESGKVTAPPLVVELHTVGQPVEKSLRQFHGRVVPADLTRVAFRIPGKVASLPVQSGQRVRKGQLLATLDSAIQEQDVADAQARFSLAKRQLQRAESLMKKGAITAAQRDEIRAGYRLAQANLELASNRLKYTRVIAPFDGVILDVRKEVFEASAAGEPVVTVYRSDRIDVLINIPDELPAQIHRAKSLLKENFQVRFSGDKSIRTMRILESSTARNPETQTFQTWLTMPIAKKSEDSTLYQPGLPVTVNVDLKKTGFKLVQGLLVPLTALHAGERQGAFRVWRYLDGQVYSTVVNVDQITQQGALVSSGLQVGDQLIVSSLSQLRDGKSVDVYQKDQENH